MAGFLSKAKNKEIKKVDIETVATFGYLGNDQEGGDYNCDPIIDHYFREAKSITTKPITHIEMSTHKYDTSLRDTVEFRVPTSLLKGRFNIASVDFSGCWIGRSLGYNGIRHVENVPTDKLGYFPALDGLSDFIKKVLDSPFNQREKIVEFFLTGKGSKAPLAEILLNSPLVSMSFNERIEQANKEVTEIGTYEYNKQKIEMLEKRIAEQKDKLSEIEALMTETTLQYGEAENLIMNGQNNENIQCAILTFSSGMDEKQVLRISVEGQGVFAVCPKDKIIMPMEDFLRQQSAIEPFAYELQMTKPVSLKEGGELLLSTLENIDNSLQAQRANLLKSIEESQEGVKQAKECMKRYIEICKELEPEIRNELSRFAELGETLRSYALQVQGDIIPDMSAELINRSYKEMTNWEKATKEETKARLQEEWGIKQDPNHDEKAV